MSDIVYAFMHDGEYVTLTRIEAINLAADITFRFRYAVEDTKAYDELAARHHRRTTPNFMELPEYQATMQFFTNADLDKMYSDMVKRIRY